MLEKQRTLDAGLEGERMGLRRNISSPDPHVDTAPKRRILIVQQSQSACPDVLIFLASMGCECSVASNIQQALPALEQKQHDAVLLDSHCLSSQETKAISEISEISRVLEGRLVILISEDTSRAIKDLVERYSLSSVQWD